jgi:hypothetical protein
MEVSMKRLLTCLITLCIVPLMLASVASAQNQEKENTHGGVLRYVAADTLACVLDRPFQIQRFALSCPGATQLLAQITDCCILRIDILQP